MFYFIFYFLYSCIIGKRKNVIEIILRSKKEFDINFKFKGYENYKVNYKIKWKIFYLDVYWGYILFWVELFFN